jgi:alpha-beta hydrolase superfamily lysophospholipase
VGHGFTQHKRALFPASLVHDLTSRGFAVAAIDAPGHGDRSPTTADDTAAVDAAWRAHWREHAAEVIAADHVSLLDLLAARHDIDVNRVGWWGLSLGTQYGVGVIGGEPRIRAAVLGLSALPDPGPRIAAYAERVRCPVFFIQQNDDEIAPRRRSTALYERIGSAEKTLAASPGGHLDVPRGVFERAYGFLEDRLR